MGFIYGDELFEFCKDQISELKSVSDSPFQCGQVEAFLDVMKKINSMPEAVMFADAMHTCKKCKYYEFNAEDDPECYCLHPKCTTDDPYTFQALLTDPEDYCSSFEPKRD